MKDTLRLLTSHLSTHILKLFGYISFLVLNLTGCAFGPDYKRPDVKLPQEWAHQSKDPTQKINLKWWENFQDSCLTDLINEAIQENLDLKAAEAGILQARANLRGIVANLFPQINMDGTISRNRRSENSVNGGGGEGSPYYSEYKAQFDASWEIDFFGRVKRGKEAALAQLESSIFDRHAISIILYADIAQNYISLRKNQHIKKVLKDLIQDWQKLYDLNLDLKKSGLANDIQLLNIKSSLDEAKAEISPIKANINTFMYQLSFLLGKNPLDLKGKLSKISPMPSWNAALILDLPSTLIQRRPDIRKAEEDLKDATALIGVHLADLFPRFSLTGIFGHEANIPSQFFKASSRYFTLGANPSFVLFDFGRIRAVIDEAKGFKDEKFYMYKNTILNAFKEVEESCIRYLMDEEQEGQLQLVYKDAAKSLENSKTRFVQGLDPYINVLNSQINLRTKELNLLDVTEKKLLDVIGLSKALGGGWS
ncbi:MAG: efflux transporter outer membrane subunit [Alphaproteobacteria bacterium]|nr:efflux transporter outer membrane subunit [Alphaproteobacteria bacterium]